MMKDLKDFLPIPSVKVFTSRKKAKKYVKKHMGLEYRWIDGVDGQASLYEHPEAGSVAVITLECDQYAAYSRIALLAHECCHIVDDWFKMIGETDIATEVRAYMLEGLMYTAIDQLGEQWLTQQAKANKEE